MQKPKTKIPFQFATIVTVLNIAAEFNWSERLLATVLEAHTKLQLGLPIKPEIARIEHDWYFGDQFSAF